MVGTELRECAAGVDVTLIFSSALSLRERPLTEGPRPAQHPVPNH